MLKGLEDEHVVWLLASTTVRAEGRLISARSDFNECRMDVPNGIKSRCGYMQDKSAITVWAYSNLSRLNGLTNYTLRVKSNFGSHSKVERRCSHAWSDSIFTIALLQESVCYLLRHCRIEG
jgi:hypothetical protein